MGVQLHQLEYFVALADEKHFGRAAARCHIAQPSLSKQIQLLERELGTPLVERARGNLRLTAGGQALYPYAKRALADVLAAKGAVLELNNLERGRIRLGATPSTSTSLLPRALARFHAAHPGIEIELHEAGSRDLVRRLGLAELDLGLVVLPLHKSDPSLAATPLVTEHLVLALRSSHPLSAKNKVAVRDLDALPLVMFRSGYDIRATVLGLCRSAGVQPKVAIEGGEMDAVLRFAEAGIGAAVVPEMVLEREGELIGVRFRPSLTRTIAVAHRRDTQLSAAAGALRQLLLADATKSPSIQPLPAPRVEEPASPRVSRARRRAPVSRRQ